MGLWGVTGCSLGLVYASPVQKSMRFTGQLGPLAGFRARSYKSEPQTVLRKANSRMLVTPTPK